MRFYSRFAKFENEFVSSSPVPRVQRNQNEAKKVPTVVLGATSNDRTKVAAIEDIQCTPNAGTARGG